MPIDPSIALQYKPPQFADPMQRMGNFLALQNAGNQNALAQYTLAKAQREDADQNALRQDLANVDISTPEGATKARNALLRIGNVKGAMDIDKAAMDRAHVTAQTDELRSKVDKQHLDQFAVIASSGDLGGALNWLKQASPNVAAPIDALYQQMRANGEPAPAAIQKLVFGLNPNVREAATATAPKLDWQQTGTQKIPMQSNAMAPGFGQQVTNVAPITMHMTPSEAANLPLAQRRTAATELQAGAALGRLQLAQEEAAGGGPMTAEAVSNAAARYNIDGTLPPLGLGKAGANMRSAILNEAAVQAGKTGLSPDEQRIQQIGNKANTAAITKLQSQASLVGAFEKNFTKNADIALQQSTLKDSTGVPIINSWINAGKRAITGDPILSAYDAIIKSTVNEYSKIISGSMGNTQMAEGEIKKVENLLAAAQTPEQVKAVITMMKRETANRMKGYEEEKAQLRSSMVTPQRRASDKNTVLRFDAQGNQIQ